MDKIVGIIPAGGQAKRIHGFFKEMMPIGIDDKDKSKFIVTSEQLITSMIASGAAFSHFILSNKKTFVYNYFEKQEILSGKIFFSNLTEEIEDLGMPYTIDYIFEQTRDYDYIMMGMPDTVVEPNNSFATLYENLKNKNADLALGVYKTDHRNKGGYIKYDPETQIVQQHIDKVSGLFPEYADNSWAIACWTKRFTEYMHDFLVDEKMKLRQKPINAKNEFYFGHVIDRAVADDQIKVIATYIEDGFYWDITEPEKYFDLLRHYTPGEKTPKIEDIRQRQPRSKVFIGHGRSDDWKDIRDFLQNRVNIEWEEFNRIPVAGKSTQQRLKEMSESVGFALLVMTAEDEGIDGKLYARPNVIHELGYFQALLGFERAVILLEEGCEEFSNIIGLTQIRFPKGNIASSFEEIRKVLEREEFIK